MSNVYLAIDLGAESGRVIAASLSDGRIELHEMHRFLHAPLELPSGLHWDITGLWREILTGLRKATEWANTHGHLVISVGVDTWGVDWAIVSESGELCGLPHAYRDPRNIASYEKVCGILSTDEIYKTTGIQMMSLNTLYSLYAQKMQDPQPPGGNSRLLFMPDLFHYWLSGKLSCESTIASTSQMIDVQSRSWASNLLDPLGIDPSLFLPTTEPGRVLGNILESVAKATGLSTNVQVVLPPSHDTASAVAAVPASGDRNWAYLSSGTWSLLGAEITKPNVTEKAQSAMFTNEQGVDGTIRFLKNIAGLWLVQQCRQSFLTEARNNQHLTYAELTEQASTSEPFRTLINPNHDAFALPGNMPEKINQFARSTDQPPCQTQGQFIRCCLESLALAYRHTLQTLDDILRTTTDVLHIVGGGGQNELLNQMTADATGRDVVVGPYEATAAGNALVQAFASGEVHGLQHLRQIVARSYQPAAFTPKDSEHWDRAHEKFLNLQ